MLWKRMIATLTAILMLLCCIAPAIAQEAPTGSTIAAAASGVVRLLSIDADGGYAGASAFGIGTVGEKTDTFVTSYSAVTDANGAPVQSIYILTEDVSLTVTSTTPYKTVKKEDVAQDAIEGQNQAREAVTIERSLVYEGFTPERHIKCEVLGYSSDQNFAVLRASRAPDDRVALSLYGGTELGIGSAIAVVGYTDPVATFATERQELRGNRGWWTVDTAAYTITAAQSYVNCITGFINQYDQTGGASFLHSAATSNSSEGGALVTESGQVAGVATAPVRYLYAPTQPEEALSSDYTGVYIADVISLLERRSIAYGAQQAPTAEPETTETPTEEPETTETPTGEPETVEPIPEPGFFEKLATLARENLLIVILVIFAMLLYTVFSTVSKVRSVEAELQRCASVVLDATTINSKLRDVLLTLREDDIQQEVRKNMLALGWRESSDGWEREINGGIRCRMKNFSVSVDESGELLTLTADVQLPLLKAMGSITNMTFPLKIYSRILYISGR